MIQRMLAIWSLVPLPFLKPAWTSGSSWFMYCWSLAWRNFEHYFTSVWDECNCAVVWAFLALAFFGIEMKAELFQSCGDYWDFQLCWHIDNSAYRALSFKIWNSSTRMPSPPLALFIVVLPKAHLPSHSRMSGSRWVIIPTSLSGSWRYYFIVLLCILATSS